MREEPIRVRVYGMFRLTRRSYVILQLALAAVLIGLAAGYVIAGFPGLFAQNALLRNLHWLFVAGLIAEAFETYAVLGIFHRKHHLAQRLRSRGSEASD